MSTALGRISETKALHDDDDDDGDSSDCSEDDALLNYKVFAKKPKKRPAATKNQEASPPSTQDTDATPKLLTDDEIEAKAHRVVQSLKFPLVKDVHRMDQLGWYVYKSKKTNPIYYPCRKCPRLETDFLYDTPIDVTKQVPIRLLGWKHSSVGRIDLISIKKFLPLNYPEEENEQKLQSFLQFIQQSEKDTFPNDNPLALKTEELVIKAMWEKVQERQAKGPAEEEEKEKPETAEATNVDLENMKPAASRPAPPTPKADKEDSTDNNYSDDDDESSVESQNQGFSPGQKTKDLLRNGDVLEYYDPMGVAGNKEWLRRATIVGVNPKHKTLPLNLDNGQWVDRDHPIKRIYKMHRGKLIDCRLEANLQPVRNFRLHTCGTQELVGLQQITQHAKRTRQKHAQDIDGFWNSEGKDDEKKESAPKNPATTSSGKDLAEDEVLATPQKRARSRTTSSTAKKGRRSVSTVKATPQECIIRTAISTAKKSRRLVSTVQATPTTTEPAWKSHLTELLDSTRKSTLSKGRRRSGAVVSLTPEQLELVLKVWTVLQQRIDQGQYADTKAAMQALIEPLELPHRRVDLIMHGDEKNLVGHSAKEGVIQALETWLTEQPPLVETSTTTTEPDTQIPKHISVVMTPSGRKRTVATSTLTASTNRRKRQKLEIAESLKRQLDDGSMASASELSAMAIPSRQRRLTEGSLVAKPSPSSARRRLSAASSDMEQTSTEIRRKRRHSSLEVGSYSASDIFKGDVQSTPSKKRPARPVYEPPSVTRRKKRQSNLLSRSYTADSVDTMPRKKQKQTKSTCPIETHRKIIQRLIEKEVQNIEQVRRYKPHLTVKQLKLTLKVWDKISQNNGREPVEKILAEIAGDLLVSHHKLTRLLTGDKDKKLSETQIKDISERLSRWLVENEIADHDKTTETANESQPQLRVGNIEPDPTQPIIAEEMDKGTRETGQEAVV